MARVDMRVYLPKRWLKMDHIPRKDGTEANWVVRPFDDTRTIAAKAWLQRNEEDDWPEDFTPAMKHAELLWQVVTDPEGLTADEILADLEPETMEGLVALVMDFFWLKLLPEGPETDTEGISFLTRQTPNGQEPTLDSASDTASS